MFLICHQLPLVVMSSRRLTALAAVPPCARTSHGQRHGQARHCLRHPSGTSSCFTTLAGLPATRTIGGRDPLTTDRAATTVWSPILLPGSTSTPLPSQTFLPMVTGLGTSGGSGSI